VKGGKKSFVDVHEDLLEHIKRHEIDLLVLIGGDGTMSQAKRLLDLGVDVVGVPKTIDNDLAATDYTFGFDTALYTATWALDRLHTTAHAHDRVIICEVMGRYAGWIALEAGIASGAHCVLIPEIEYDIDRIVKKISSLGGRYSSYAVIVCSEGAKEIGGDFSTDEEVVKTKDGKIAHLPKLKGAAEKLAGSLKGKVIHDIRVTVLGHVQRGGSPTPFDRILGLRFGVAAADLIARGGFGRMVALKTPNIVDVPLDEVIGKQKLVAPDGELVSTARSLGIELGA
jgi:6-phosphofructokinase